VPTTIVGSTSEEHYLGSARRYYLSKRRQAADAGELGLERAWQAKQEAQPGTPLPGSFPAAAALASAGYPTNEDLRGASVDELVGAGLSLTDATAALAALE
jgi:hypothetical protein